MTIKETMLAVVVGLALLGMPAMAGGPVIVEDETDTVVATKGNWVVPVVIGGIVLCALFCGGDDDPAPPPVECFKAGC